MYNVQRFEKTFSYYIHLHQKNLMKHQHKSFAQAFSKACGFQGQRPWWGLGQRPNTPY